MKKRCAEHGFMSLFFLFAVIPMIVIALAISIDLAKYRTELGTTQEALDEAAIRASKVLPYQADAAIAAKRYLSSIYPNQFSDPTRLNIKTSGSSISVSYSGESVLPFAPLLSALSLGKTTPNTPLSAATRSRVTPFDVILMMDASSYMAPTLAGPAWGNATEWPDSSFFRNEYELSGSGGPIDSRVATQLCFSPSLWHEKKALLSTYQYFSNFDLDQVGVAVFPGKGSPVNTIREVKPLSDTTAAGNGTSAEASFINYTDITRGDSLCAAAAEREYNGNSYKFPVGTAGLSEWKPSSSAPINMIIPPDWDYNTNYAPYLSVKQSIWSTAARNSTTDFPLILSYASTALLSAPVRTERGNLSASSVRWGVIFSGGRPFINGEQWRAERTDLSSVLSGSLKSLSEIINLQLKAADYRVKLFLHTI